MFVAKLTTTVTKKILMKINFANILLCVVFVVTMAASFFCSEQEQSILSEKNTVRTATMKSPLQVKGVVYFVTDDQVFYYEKSRDIFIFGCMVNVAFMVWLRKRRGT